MKQSTGPHVTEHTRFGKTEIWTEENEFLTFWRSRDSEILPGIRENKALHIENVNDLADDDKALAVVRF